MTVTAPKARLIDGKAVAADLRAEVAQGVEAFKKRHGIAPGLAVVLVGNDPASEVYVRNKDRAAHEIALHGQPSPAVSSSASRECTTIGRPSSLASSS